MLIFFVEAQEIQFLVGFTKAVYGDNFGLTIGPEGIDQLEYFFKRFDKEQVDGGFGTEIFFKVKRFRQERYHDVGYEEFPFNVNLDNYFRMYAKFQGFLIPLGDVREDIPKHLKQAHRMYAYECPRTDSPRVAIVPEMRSKGAGVDDIMFFGQDGPDRKGKFIVIILPN